MKTAPVVSIIIPTFNRRRLLAETIDSVRDQSLENWELFVIDDCSTDDTYEYTSSIKDDRITPIRLTENSERSRARNLGLSRAKGKYVLFLDDDDLLYPNSLKDQVEALESSPGSIASIGSYIMFDENGEVRDFPIVKKAHVANIYNDLLFGWMATAGHTLFVTQAVRDIGGWNEDISFAEDHELWLRIARDSTVVLIPNMILKYRVHGGQWRPDNQKQIMTDLRNEAIQRLGSGAQKNARGIMRARELLPEAEELYENAKAFSALKKYIQIAWNAPVLLFSPLSNPVTFKPMLKCFLGNTGIRLGRYLTSRIR